MKKALTLIITFLSFQDISAQCWAKIASHDHLTYAIHSNGSLWRWGHVANGNNINVPSLFDNARVWVDVSVGENHAAGITTTGGIFTWGDNIYGQLGDETNLSKTYPVQIGNTLSWSKVSCGREFTMAIKTDGTLWVWGSNDRGKLGLGGGGNRNIPVKVGTDTNWTFVKAGELHALAIKSNGTLWGAGDDDYGQMGSATGTDDVLTFTQIGTHTDWNVVSTHNNSNLGLKSSANSIWVWGANGYSQLGEGTTVQRNSPMYLDISDSWNAISMGETFAGGINSLGQLKMWGRNAYGQLGTGNTTNHSEPFQIGTATNWQKIYTGSEHAFATKTDGTLWAWGYNGFGNLGIGDEIDKWVPTLVPCPTLGIDDFNEDHIFVYPNPVQDFLFITNQTNIEFTKVSISDFLGKNLIEYKGNVNEIDVQTLPKGLYILKLQSDTTSLSIKIFID